ncbi:MAG TPA: hypothetical protein VF741_02300 [Candidatus Aquilonibacter sp.]
MSTRIPFLVISLTAILIALPAYAQESATRHLVYNFTLGVQGDSHAITPVAPQAPSIHMGGSSSPINDQGPPTPRAPTSNESSGVSSDSGAINVDVFAPQADGGLHVRVSEIHSSHDTAPTDCVVYPSTSVACAARISSEAALVLSTLSPQFFQPAALDAKNHWHEDAGTPGLSLDFTASAPKGSVVWITEERNQKVSSGTGATIRGTAVFTYDTIKRVATDVKDHETIQRGESGQTSNLTVDTTATLTSDSGTAQH